MLALRLFSSILAPLRILIQFIFTDAYKQKGDQHHNAYDDKTCGDAQVAAIVVQESAQPVR
jgi:hypothetical protein